MRHPTACKLIGIAGGTCAGKTTLVHRLAGVLGDKVGVLHLDHYFKPGTPTYNRPEAIDWERVMGDLDRLNAGETLRFKNRRGEVHHVPPRPFLLLEGHLALCHAPLRDRMALRIYVDMDDDVRAVRRLDRNVNRFGMPFAEVADWYLKDARTGHEQYIAPTKRLADLIIWGDLKDTAVNSLITVILAL